MIDYTCGENVELGIGTKVWQYATICDGVTTGENCVIGSGCWIGKNVKMGNNVRIQHGAFIPNDTRIGHNVFIGPNVTMTDDKYPMVNNASYDRRPPVIEDNVSIGAGAVILPGVKIWRGAMIGAGAVVTKEVSPGVLSRSLNSSVSIGPRRDLYE